MSDKKKVAFISGGGSLGAFHVGTMSHNKTNYNIVVGISTGALMAPFVALGMYEELEAFYTSVDDSDIYTVNPFKNPLKAAWRVIRGKTTLGDTTALKHLIDACFTEQMYGRLVSEKKEAIVGVYNKTLLKMEYHSSKNTDFETFKTMMWASTAVPLVMSLVEHEGHQYEDGGVADYIPQIERYNNTRWYEVDVYIHKHEIEPTTAPLRIKNVFQNAFRLLESLTRDNTSDDFAQISAYKSVKNIYMLPADAAYYDAMSFNKKYMREMVEIGFHTAFDNSLKESKEPAGQESYGTAG